MDANYHTELMIFLDKVREHINSGTSLMLAKTKTMAEFKLNEYDIQMLHNTSEYKNLRHLYLTTQRQNRSWTYKLINQ